MRQHCAKNEVFPLLRIWSHLLKKSLLENLISCAVQFLDLIQFLTIESPLKIMKNVFYFMLKAPFLFKIFTFLPWLFGPAGKQLDKKAKINFKINDFTDWITDNCNAFIAQCLKK